MTQVNKKFLEEQVRAMMEIGLNEFIDLGLDPVLKPEKKSSKEDTQKQILNRLRDKNGKDGNVKLPNEALSTIATLIFEIAVGSKASWDTVIDGAGESLAFGFGYGSYINSTISKFKDMDAETASILPFISLAPQSSRYDPKLEWREEFFKDFYKVCDKYAAIMLPMIRKKESDNLADAYEDFMDDIRDVLEEYKVSNAEEAFSWALGGQTSAEKFGNFFNERQLNPTSADAKNYAEYLIDSKTIRNKTNSDFSTFLEQIVLKSHKYLGTGTRGKGITQLNQLPGYLQKQIDAKKSNIPELFGSAAYIQYLRSTYNPLNVLYAITDISLSLISTALILQTLGASKLLVPIGKRIARSKISKLASSELVKKILTKETLRAIIGGSIKVGSSFSANVAFYAYLGGQENQLVLNRLIELDAAYWSIANNNEYRYADVFTIPNLGKNIRALGGGLTDALFRFFLFTDKQKEELGGVIGSRRREIDKETSKDAWIQKVMSPGHKKELLNFILYGRGSLQTATLIDPFVKKGEFKEFFASMAGFEDGIIGSYEKLYLNMLKGQKDYAELLKKMPLAGKEIDFFVDPRSKEQEESSKIPEDGISEILDQILQSYENNDKNDTDDKLEDIKELFKTIGETSKLLQDADERLAADQEKLKQQIDKDNKIKSVKQQFNKSVTSSLGEQPWMKKSQAPEVKAEPTPRAPDGPKVIDTSGANSVEDVLKLLNNQPLQENSANNIILSDNQFLITMFTNNVSAKKAVEDLEKLKGNAVKVELLDPNTNTVAADKKALFVEFAKTVNKFLQDNNLAWSKTSLNPLTTGATTGTNQSPEDDIIIIGDSNARPLADRWYKRGVTVKGTGGFYLMDGDKIVAPTVSNGFVSTILKTTQEFFKQKGDSYKPSIAIVHMGYNGPGSAFPAFQETINFLKEKGVQDIRVIDVKVSGNKYAKTRDEENAYIKSIQDLSEKIRTLSGVKIIDNKEQNNVDGDKFHFTKESYNNLYSAAMSGASSSPASPTIKPVASDPATGQQQIKVRNSLATEMISDVTKFLNRQLTTSETNNLEKIYKTAIQELSYIDSKEAWNSIRYAYGKKESSNKYNPQGPRGWEKRIYTGRYQLGPSPYKTAREIVSRFGITIPDYPYVNNLKWSPGSQEKYYKDPIAQEASFLGFVLNNKNKVSDQAEDPKDLIGLPGIAHNVGAGAMKKWVDYRKQYRDTKDVQYLYKMWSLQDGNGTPGENFMRILLRQGGYETPDLPMGFYWSGGSKKNDYKHLAEIKKFDPDLGNFIEKNYASNWHYDKRIFAFSEGNYAEKLWNWVTTSGQNKSSKINAKLSKNIKDYYNENGDPIGSPSGGIQSDPPFAAASPTVSAGGPSSPVGPTLPATTVTPASAVPAPVAAAPAQQSSEESLSRAINDVDKFQTLKDIIIGYMMKYGPSKSKVISNTIRLENIFKRMTAGDSQGFQRKKFIELANNVHQTYRETFRGIYNREKARDLEKANQIMAFLHRPRIIVNIETDRMLFTNIDDFSLSFEFGKPYGNQVGVAREKYPFFTPDKFGNGIEKQELKRIISQNKQLIEKFREKTESLGPGMYGERGLGEEEKRIYLRYFTTLSKIYSLAEDSLEPGGSMLRKALFMDNFASTLYLT